MSFHRPAPSSIRRLLSNRSGLPSNRRGLLAGAAALVGAGLAKIGASERAEAAHSGSDETIIHANQNNTTGTMTKVTAVTSSEVLPALMGLAVVRSVDEGTYIPHADGVQGIALNTSTIAAGVRGVGTNGPGVMGSNGLFSPMNVTAQAGVLGISNGVPGFGVKGSTVADGPTISASAGVWGTSNSSMGVFGSSVSNIGVRGLSTTNFGVFGQSTSSPSVVGVSTGQFGVWGKSTNGAGVNGESVGSSGVQGSSNTGPGVYGSSQGNAGVFGTAPQVGILGLSQIGLGVQGTSATNAGVFGQSTGNAGVFGISPYAGVQGSSPSIAVWGQTIGGTAIFGQNLGGSGYAAQFAGNVYISGSLTVTGSAPKSAAVPHPDGSQRRMYCMEAPESWFEDFGRGTLTNGRAAIQLDPDFDAVVKGDNYHVFLTEYGDLGSIYVEDIRPHRFVVKSRTNASGEFGYRVVAKRKDLTNGRMEKVAVPKALEARDAPRPLSNEALPKPATAPKDAVIPEVKP